MNALDIVVLVIFAAFGVCGLMFLGYLAACAGAGRWLTFEEWL
jgi:hypothetical protein